MVKQRRKEKNCLTNEERSCRRKTRQYLQQVVPRQKIKRSSKNERVSRRFVKFAENRMKNFRLEAETIKDGVQLSEKREDSRDSRMM